MSFLNPVNEPVLRFKSTDADAPQINYNARTAGDVKAVLKACLVTGYGSVASAGWTAANEVDNVIEFVSPSVAMSDYRLGVDDSAANNTNWYYQYQDARVNPVRNIVSKTPANINKNHASNGWQLLITSRGLFFIEMVMLSSANYLISRMTYWGRTKSALKSSAGKNIAFLVVGLEQDNYPSQVFSPSLAGFRHYEVGGYNAFGMASVSIYLYQLISKSFSISDIDVAGKLYLTQGAAVVAEHPGLLLNSVNKVDDLFGVTDTYVDGRATVRICIAPSFSGASDVVDYAQSVLIYLDNWEY